MTPLEIIGSFLVLVAYVWLCYSKQWEQRHGITDEEVEEFRRMIATLSQPKRKTKEEIERAIKNAFKEAGKD